MGLSMIYIWENDNGSAEFLKDFPEVFSSKSPGIACMMHYSNGSMASWPYSTYVAASSTSCRSNDELIKLDLP
jgi:hypothetical protein